MKMKKTIIITTILILVMSGMALADTQTAIGITTTEDLYVYAELSAGGDLYFGTNLETNESINYHIDGLDIDKTINELRTQNSKGMTDLHVARMLKYASDIVKYGNDREYLSHSPRDEELMIAQALDDAFLSHREAKYFLDVMKNLNMRLEALENTVDEMASELYCKHKINITKEYGLPSVSCGDTNYRVDVPGFDAIGVKPVPEEKEEETGVNETEPEPVCPEGKSLCGDDTCKYVCVNPKVGVIMPEEICIEKEDDCLQECHLKGYVKWYTKRPDGCER